LSEVAAARPCRVRAVPASLACAGARRQLGSDRGPDHRGARARTASGSGVRRGHGRGSAGDRQAGRQPRPTSARAEPPDHDPLVKARAAYTDVVLLKRLMREARGYWPHIGAVFVISMLAAPLALLTPVPLKIAVDSVLGSHPVPGFLDAILPGTTHSDTALLVALAVMFAAIAVLTQIQDMGNNLLQTYTGEKLLLRFRGKLFQHIQRLSLAYHDRIGTADSTYRIQYDAMSLQYVAVQSVI